MQPKYACTRPTAPEQPVLLPRRHGDLISRNGPCGARRSAVATWGPATPRSRSRRTVRTWPRCGAATLYTGRLAVRSPSAAAAYTTMSWDPATTCGRPQRPDRHAARHPETRQPRGQIVNPTPTRASTQPGSSPRFGSRRTASGWRSSWAAASCISGRSPGRRAPRQAARIALSPLHLPALPPGQHVHLADLVRSRQRDHPGRAGPAVTEYPVNGGTCTSISPDASMETITASTGHALIAGLAKGRLAHRREPHRFLDPGQRRATRQPAASRRSTPGDAKPRGSAEPTRETSLQVVMFRFGSMSSLTFGLGKS